MKSIFLSVCLALPCGSAMCSDPVFHPKDRPLIQAAPGVSLQELIGKAGAAQSDKYSVARFQVAKGASTGTSFNKTAEESFLVISGKGHVVVDGKRAAISAGSVVIIPAKIPHSLQADADEAVEFYAICAPAFDPADFVGVEQK